MSTQKRFLRDVREHRMTIEIDQGVHRSLYFGKPGTGYYHFRLVTWPGHLAISGDCGDYSFSRLRDMFEFFRFAGPQYDRTDRINVDYWAEKLRSVCKNGGQEDLDDDAYLAAIRSDFASHIGEMSLSEAKQAVRQAKWDYLLEAPSTREEAVARAMGWQCPVTGKYPFSDFWDHRITSASFRLVWCLRAIQWGIKRYDLHHQGRTQADHDRRVLAGAA